MKDLIKGLKRGLFGIPFGIAYGTTITLIIMAFSQTDIQYLTKASFVKSYFASAVVGFSFASTSVTWEVEKWSLLKQTILHFVPTYAVLLLAGLWAEWFSLNVKEMVLFFVIFVVIYAICFFAMRWFFNRKAKEINELIDIE